ncbi:MAG: thioredoxin domain-containing protein [Chlorobi bacterium]|nr:thioredoxin domain-containing protein [Chlorobiota bacterium]MCI0715124.1 thioredoxin domain-containing protein [Chlorobiota bacterium]
MKIFKGKRFYLIALLLFVTAIVMFVSFPGNHKTFCKTSSMNDSNYNRLIGEKSPYLLQHANNPVNWYPWGEEAFETAKKENKPVFLSIGYSTCHWCHVMEEESFEDTLVARLMNDAFVSIKVDREERPDIDNIYMAVCQAITGSGGWPLTIVMTPDKKPFFAATYIPKNSRFGILGMTELVPRLKDAWLKQRGEIEGSANEITNYLKNQTDIYSGGSLSEITLHNAYNQLRERYDEVNGGFGSQPKFPTPHNILFLLRYWNRTGEPKALEMAEITLQKMRNGGMYDHIGFGFHRYSTDSKWFAPHFEKMLYDQALLTIAYTEAYQATGNKFYKQTAEEILEYVLRDMTSPEGGFYSAEDADSEGEEGKFYLWTEEEIRSILDENEANLFIKVFNIVKAGNFNAEGGSQNPNILHIKKPFKEIAGKTSISENELRQIIEASKVKLFNHREKRIRPHKDDKILTDWNGLMIAALSKAARVFNEEKYEAAAKRSADFIMKTLRKNDGTLLHRYRENEAAINAHVDDYSFLIWGLIELYETTFDVDYLKTAIELNDIQLKNFWDSNGGFYFTASDGEKLLIRQKEYYDGAVPSGNSVAMLNLMRLGRITANSDFETKADLTAKWYSKAIESSPQGFTMLLCALDFAAGPSYEVVISGNSKAEDTKSMLMAVNNVFIPNMVLILRPTETESPEIVKIAEFTENQTSIGGKSTAYICKNYSCDAPTTDLKRMLKLLREKKC